MIAMASATLSPRQRRVVDQALLAYVRWRARCAAVDDAYRWWAGAVAEDEAHAHAAYCSALDREEAAAHDLERLWNLAEPCRETMAVEGQTV